MDAFFWTIIVWPCLFFLENIGSQDTHLKILNVNY
jgi:hypothetical protein